MMLAKWNAFVELRHSPMPWREIRAQRVKMAHYSEPLTGYSLALACVFVFLWIVRPHSRRRPKLYDSWRLWPHASVLDCGSRLPLLKGGKLEVRTEVVGTLPSLELPGWPVAH